MYYLKIFLVTSSVSVTFRFVKCNILEYYVVSYFIDSKIC